MKVGLLSVFNYGSNIGGIENHIYFISNELKKLGNELIIFQPIEKEKYTEKERYIDGIKIVFISIEALGLFKILSKFNGSKTIGFLTAFLNKAKYIFHYKKIAQEILKYNVDIVHQHDFISNIFTTKYLARIGVKVALTNHTGEYLFFKKSFFGRLLLKFFLKHYVFIVGPSKELTPFQYNKNSYTIYNGVDLDIFCQFSNVEKIRLRKSHGFDQNDIIIFCPRRWAPTKGVIYLIESILKNKYSNNYKFLFAGSDYDGYPLYKKQINQMIENSVSDAKNSIKKLGNLSIDKMCEMYNISDIVVIPSLMEAVSLSAIEAMATGTPVISADVGGMPELIIDGENGLLIRAESEKEIYAALMKLANLDLYNKIKINSLDTANKFSWKSIAMQTNKLYVKYVI